MRILNRDTQHIIKRTLLCLYILFTAINVNAQNSIHTSKDKILLLDGQRGLSERNYTPRDSLFVDSLRLQLIVNSGDQTSDVLKLGVKQNGNDQRDVIQSLISSNKTLFFPRGIYTLTNSILINDISNLKIVGEPGTVFTTTLNKVFTLSGNLTNIEIAGINFVSTKISAMEDTEGLIFGANYGDNDIQKDIWIHHCDFKIPSSKANAIKFVSEGLNSLDINVICENNTADGVGRMFFETQNHHIDQSKARLQNIICRFNYVKNIGTIHSGISVSAFSVSGYTINASIDDNIIEDVHTSNDWNVLNYAVENAGCFNMTTSRNKIISKKYGFTGLLNSGSVIQARNWVVADNIIKVFGGSDINKVRGMEIGYLSDSHFINNIIYSDGFIAKFDNSINNKFANNTCYSKTSNGLYISNGSINNEFSYNTIDVSAYGPAANAIQFNGSATTNNTVYFNKLVGFGGNPGIITQSGSASGNDRYKITDPLYLYSPDASAYPLQIGTAGGSYIKFGDQGRSIGAFTASGTGQNLYIQNGLEVNGSINTSSNITTGSFRAAVSTKTAAYTIGLYDHTILANATNSTFTLTLLSAATAQVGAIRVIKKVDNSSNVVTIVTTDSQTIDGVTSYILSLKNNYVTIQSDGANWFIIGNN